MGENSSNKAAPKPGAWSRFARGRFLDRALAVALVAGIAAAAAAALSPGLLSQRIPYDERDLGNVATATIKATRAYDIPDEETTRRMRDEAVAAVRSVYEHDAAAGDAIASRIRDGFVFARAYLADQRAEPPRQGTKDAAAPKAIPLDSVRDELERRLGARLEEEELGFLSRADFAPAVEEVVVGLVTQAMREMVVGDREELAQHRSRGIAIRRIGRGGVFEEALTEIGGVRDLASARARIEVGAESLAGMQRELKQAAVNLARREVRSNLKYDPDLTRKRREDAAAAVKPVAIQLKKGEKIIGDGERIEARHLAIFQGMRAQSQEVDLIQVRLGGGLFAALLTLGLFGFAKAGFGSFRLSRKDRFLLAALLVGMLFLAHLGIVVSDVLRERTPGIPAEAFTYAFPFAAGAMLVRFVLGSEAAILFAVAFAALVGILTGNSLSFGLFALLGSLAGATRVVGARDRGGLLRAGMAAGLVQAAAVLCFALFAGQILSWDVLLDAAAAAVGGAVFTPMLLVALIAIAEGLLGYTTDLRLLELANLNHPALKELIVQAPGTYHHSIIVGTLVEAAAEEIGANPLLAKVCAYYHDLGKGRNPLYFGENQRGVNRHDELPPDESAKIIVEHVTKGLELARKHKLPKRVAAAIPEHHGTRLVGYFYHKALRAQEGREEPGTVDPALFRYAGPKPQSPETALVMMADAAEAASRSMADPTPEKLHRLVGKLIEGIAADGQLDECSLTLRDLSRIADSFTRTLGGIYHSRPEYPPGAQDLRAPPDPAPAAALEPPARLPAQVRVLRGR